MIYMLMDIRKKIFGKILEISYLYGTLKKRGLLDGILCNRKSIGKNVS